MIHEDVAIPQSVLKGVLAMWAKEAAARNYAANTYPSRKRINQDLWREAKVYDACADDLRAVMANEIARQIPSVQP